MWQQDWMDNSGLFLAMIRAGHEELRRRKEEVNAMNVFPVPDGDTGTNMYLTFTSGITEMDKLPPGMDLTKLAEALALGLLMGARGNSGVILSQLFRGFQMVFGRVDRMTPRALADALQSGVQTAYRAVARPVEGTILTVAREAALAAERALRLQDASLQDVMEAAVIRGEAALQKTPELLPILRQAGVVDSGGQGLIYIYKGFMNALTAGQSEAVEVLGDLAPQGEVVYIPESTHGQGEYGYCTEFIIQRSDRDAAAEDAESELRAALEHIGDSLVVVVAAGLIKVHVHTLHPGDALEKALSFGALTKIKIDNMTEQYHSRQEFNRLDAAVRQPGNFPGVADVSEKPCGIVAVAAGDGLVEVFQSIGVGAIVSGGQSMNPSTEEILTAVRQVHARDVFVLPNNGNVILAAEQVREVSGGHVHVIPTLSLGAGFGAALVFSPQATPQENDRLMREAMSRIMSGAITASVRDTSMGEHDIGEGDYIGLINGDIRFVDEHRAVVLQRLLEQFCADGAEICTLFFAQHELQTEAQEMVDWVSELYPAVEFETRYGGQPVYDFLLAAE